MNQLRRICADCSRSRASRHCPVRSASPFYFSLDGMAWETWAPAELRPEQVITVLGMGSDFVVLSSYDPIDGITFWIGRDANDLTD